MGRKNKKKQSSQEQVGPTEPSSSGASQDPQSSLTTIASEKKQETPRTTGSDQSKPEEWTTTLSKGKGMVEPRGGATTDEKRDTGNQPGLQKSEQHRVHYQSGHSWEKSGDHSRSKKEIDDGGRFHQKPSEGFRKSEGPYQQRGNQQWSTEEHQQRQRGGPPQRQGGSQQLGPSGGKQWPSRGYQQGYSEGYQYGQDRGQQWRGKGQDQYIGNQQQGQRGQEQWRGNQQQRGGGVKMQGERQQFRDDTRPSEKQYQPRAGQRGFKDNVYQDTLEREDRHKSQSLKVTDQPPNVWQRKQKPVMEPSATGQQAQGVEGAPDKVQFSSTSTAQLSPQNISQSSTPEEPSMALVPVYKDPGTLARKRIKVQSNHFALDLGNLKEAYHYDVNITEFDKNKQKEPKKLQAIAEGKENVSKNRRVKDKVQYRVVGKFLEKYFPDRHPSFDGKKNLYTSKPLTNNLNDVLIDTDITVVDDFGKEKTFSIEIKHAKTISLIPQIEAGTRHPPMLTQNAIQCIDIVLRNAPIHCFNQIGSSFFSKPGDRIIELGGGMEMYYGFYQSVIMGGRPLLNLHLVHKAFPKNMPVLDTFLEILNSKDTRRTFQYQDIAVSALQSWQKKSLNEYIKTLKVAYEIPKFSKVIYRVNELVGSPKQETMIHNGTKKTILEYFRTEKGYDIKYPDLPLLWVGNPKGNIKIFIPPELCKIEKDQSVKRKMEDFQTRNMISEAATDTHKHRKNTMDRFNDARYNDSPCVQEFGFSVSDKFEIMDARILPAPRLEYDRGSVDVRKGLWQNKQFLNAKRINNWAIVDISNDNFVNRKLNDFLRELKNAGRSCGLQIESEPDFPVVKSRSRYGPSKADLENFFKDQKTKNYDIIFVIIPSSEQGSSIYSYVKGAAELNAGCLTQCIKSRTITGRFNMATATNILLKVNGKLDGINHTFTSDCKPKLLQKRPVMIMGADVTHPGPIAGNMPSVAAVIASHDPTAFQYNLCLRLQEPKMEYILDLKAIVKEQLEFYFKKNRGAKPEAIIFFRDGVSEGQFAHVLSIELKAIKDACTELQPDGYNPAITFLVVQKRHHTRIFPAFDKDSDDQDYTDKWGKTKQGNYNVPAGTCVDTAIVNPTMQNFYLVSHASLKGVSRPTKYCTLYDDLDLSNDQIEELSYYLCHMFARCNRSVSYPAPTYYAHLGALRGKAYIKPALDENRFDMENLKKEMQKIQIQINILNDNPMFFI